MAPPPAATAPQPPPLPSWNDTASTKRDCRLRRAGHTRRQRRSSFPWHERIAVFDNDGTLWGEQPLDIQVVFALDRVKALAPAASRVEDAAAVQGRPRR